MEEDPLEWTKHKSPKGTNLLAASMFLAQPLCHPPPAGALVFSYLQTQPLAFALEEPQPKSPNHSPSENFLLEKHFDNTPFPWAAPLLEPYSSRNSKLVIKDSVYPREGCE